MVNCSMLSLLCAAFLLPSILCSKFENSLSEGKLKIRLPRSQTTSTKLIPLDLSSQNRPDNIYDYGFILDTNEEIPSEIIVEKHTLTIPKDAKALMLTLSKHKGESSHSDIQISTYNGEHLFEFEKMILKDNHIPIYLQLANSSVKSKHSQTLRSYKEEDHFKQSGTNNETNKFDNTAKLAVRNLFKRVGQQDWPRLVIGYISSTDARVQIIPSFTQTANKFLAPEFFSIPYENEHVKIQNFLIHLSKKLEASKRHTNPHIIIEMEIVKRRRDGSISFPPQASVKLRLATDEEVKDIPVINDNSFNLYFHFFNQENSRGSISPSSSNSEDKGEEPTMRSPRSRRRRQAGDSPESKSQ